MGVLVNNTILFGTEQYFTQDYTNASKSNLGGIKVGGVQTVVTAD